MKSVILILLNWSHNPYFNRWFSAIYNWKSIKQCRKGHNPYFNRWFSAIIKMFCKTKHEYNVTILILIDGFLQFVSICSNIMIYSVTILILIDGFLQYEYKQFQIYELSGHNPYFHRWFSAIKAKTLQEENKILSQSLF